MKIFIFTLFCMCIVSAQDLFYVGEIDQYTEHKLSTDAKGKTFTCHGKIEKQGKFCYFTTYAYKKNLFTTKRYYVTNDVAIKSSWVKITAKYTKIEDMRVEIEVQKCEDLNQEKWKKVCKLSQVFFHKNFAAFDLNLFKKTQRFARAMQHLKKKDLNTSPYIKDNAPKISFVDHQQQIMAIYCGKSILYKSMIRGDFLSYHVVYDLKNEKILRVCATNTGYFLE
ncbi:hypothetical protein [Candidatus Uabimicrobium amorphum]|uniref:Uncharacterized protein n=1 Tax=Uabimicrobium amorphum TaxID=2596890 RepID=A0A5S9ITF3_UABAM|nr:hypothetical protein [Candidatus Uabimicrobium amorphum]BBM87231.1 hypothetical protein UABAM_05634 [Candidatus Uabimicrobium amorphum]